jgi:paraquat-inducible protein B
MESFQALLSGGVTFESFPDMPNSNPAAEGRAFPLYPNRDAIREAAIVEEVPYVLYFDDSVRGLSPGAPVEFRGVRIGVVKSIHPELNLRDQTIRIAVIIAIQPDRLRGNGDVQGAQIIGDPRQQQRGAMIAALVERGLRAQLQTASLITGQQMVSLEFFPDEPKKSIGREGKIPEIPTVPSTFNEIASSATSFLNKLNELPLNVLVGDIRKTIGTLDATLMEIKGLTQTVQGETRPTVAELRDTADAARKALAQAEIALVNINESIGSKSDVPESLSTMLRELAAAARSIRDLADYLERHPDALVKGKSGASR